MIDIDSFAAYGSVAIVTVIVAVIYFSSKIDRRIEAAKRSKEVWAERGRVIRYTRSLEQIFAMYSSRREEGKWIWQPKWELTHHSEKLEWLEADDVRQSVVGKLVRATSTIYRARRFLNHLKKSELLAQRSATPVVKGFRSEDMHLSANEVQDFESLLNRTSKCFDEYLSRATLRERILTGK